MQLGQHWSSISRYLNVSDKILKLTFVQLSESEWMNEVLKYDLAT